MAVAEQLERDDTRPKHALPAAMVERKWRPGQSGNPNGRPKGARNLIADQFIADLHTEWQAHGADTLSKARKADPVAFIKIVAGLLPKDINLNVSAAERFGQIIEHIEQQANSGGLDGGRPIAPPTDLPVISSTCETGQADTVSAIPAGPTPGKAQD